VSLLPSKVTLIKFLRFHWQMFYVAFIEEIGDERAANIGYGGGF
jgi:hypothetical protein